MGPLLFLKKGSYELPAEQSVLKRADYALLLEAQAVLAQARIEAESIRQEASKAYEEEKKRGYEEAVDECKREMAESMLDTVSAGVNYLENLEGSIVDLVLNSLRKIVEGFNDRERVMGVVRKGLGYVRNQKRVVLRLPPEDDELAREEFEALRRDFPGIDILDLRPDPRLSKGSCVLESEMGLIDAGLEVQMAAISRSFLRQFKGQAGQKP
jgi:type III secretion protein L